MSAYKGRELRMGRFWTEDSYWGWQVVYKGESIGFRGDPPIIEGAIEVVTVSIASVLADKTNTEGGEDFEKAIYNLLLSLNEKKETERDAEGSTECPCAQDSIQHTSGTSDKLLKVGS